MLREYISHFTGSHDKAESTMSEVINKSDGERNSNITQLLNSFNHFNELIENTAWVKTAQVEDIKTVFKLGNFVENSAKHLTSQKALQEFVNLMQINKINTNNIDYLLANDFLLKTFFRCENISEITLDIVIRIYTSLYPKDRLQPVLYDLIISSNNLESLAQFVNLLPKTRIEEFEYYLHLSYLSDFCKIQKESLINNIREKLALYNLDSSLGSMLGILSLENVTEKDKIVQNIILEIILEKMLERTILSNSFWYALFHKININVIRKVCDNFESFRNSLFSFIVYIGSMMDKDDEIWKCDPNKSICADINYYDLVVVIKNINATNGVFVCNKLDEAKTDTGSDIWEQIKDEINVIF